MSQPTRAVLSFCEIMGIPYKLNYINVMRGDQRKP